MLTIKAKAPKKKLHIKKGDKVVVISGQYKSDPKNPEAREVLKVDARSGKIIVAGVNLRWKHQARSQQNPKGGRVQVELPMPASKVLLFSEKLGKGTRTRTEVVDGKKVRVGVKCGTRFD